LFNKGLDHSWLLLRGDFNYSNTNILIAEQMIEKAAGKGCEKLIKEKIFMPFGLNNTYFGYDKPHIRGRIISGYSDTMKSVGFTEAATSWAGLACKMHSTASDMESGVMFYCILQCYRMIQEKSSSHLFLSRMGSATDFAC
jgi:CubicO group peptidase (beta-lactamase class C family)